MPEAAYYYYSYLIVCLRRFGGSVFTPDLYVRVFIGLLGGHLGKPSVDFHEILGRGGFRTREELIEFWK